MLALSPLVGERMAICSPCVGAASTVPRDVHADRRRASDVGLEQGHRLGPLPLAVDDLAARLRAPAACNCCDQVGDRLLSRRRSPGARPSNASEPSVWTWARSARGIERRRGLRDGKRGSTCEQQGNGGKSGEGAQGETPDWMGSARNLVATIGARQAAQTAVRRTEKPLGCNRSCAENRSVARAFRCLCCFRFVRYLSNQAIIAAALAADCDGRAAMPPWLAFGTLTSMVGTPLSFSAE